MIKCAVVGGSGYIGGEIIRLLLSHPNVNLVAVTANEVSGRPIEIIHPNFCHTKLIFNELYDVSDAEVVFLALPPGKAMEAIKLFSDKIIIDTSADFRLRNLTTYEQFYKTQHIAFDEVKSFKYGLPELFRSTIQTAKNIAAPGCFATAVILSLLPIVAEKLNAAIVINAVTGSSGSGIKNKDTTHHAFRENSYFAYELFTHRHIPEIKQAIQDKTGQEINFIFQPHSGPFVRGIYVTSIIKLKQRIAKHQLQEIYQQYYSSEFFIRLREGSPNIKWVQQTNFCDIAVETNGETAVVMAAIDNLLKGGAGQAVQCFNIMFGFEESMGLKMVNSNP